MREDDRPPDDAFVDDLAALDEAMARGQDADPSCLVPGEGARLNRGLNCLKLLHGLRRRQTDTTLLRNGPGSDSTFAPLSTRLPTRFGKFDLARELGRGGFGVVFLARDRSLDCDVALKVPHAHVLTNDDLRERFRREARAAAGLHHPNIVSIREAGEIGPVSYLVSAYCPGPSLADWQRLRKEPAPYQLAARWLADLAAAVGYAHDQGVLHRDLKPANILLHQQSPGNAEGGTSPPEESYVPMITDFGLARLEREGKQTATGALLGTPAYMAPEQASGAGPMGPGVDVHALGVVLYELLTGCVPYRGESDAGTLRLVAQQEPVPLRKLRPGVPRDLETICHKCLQKDPQHRYATAAALAADLRRFLKGEPIQARPVSWMERGWRACRRHPLVTGLAAALVIATVGGLGGTLWQFHHRVREAEAARTLLVKYLDLLRADVAEAQELLADAGTEKQGREKLLVCLHFYEVLLREAQAEPALVLETARLANQAGYLHSLLAQSTQAAGYFQRSIALYEDLRSGRAGDRALALEQARVMTRLALLYRNRNKFAESEPLYRQAITLVTRDAAVDADDPEALAFVSQVLVFNGLNLRKLHRPEEAERAYREGLALAEKGLTRHPEDKDLLQSKALALDDLGSFYLDPPARYPETEHCLQAGLALRQALLAREPKDRTIRTDTARSYWKLGDLHARRDPKDTSGEAEKYFGVSIRMNDELRRDFPGMPLYRHNAAADRANLVPILIAQGRPDEADKQIREALEIREACRREFPHYESNYTRLSLAYFQLGELLVQQNLATEADRAFQTGVEVSEQLAREHADDAADRTFHVGQLAQLTRLHERAKRYADAVDVHQKLIRAREELVRDFAQVTQYLRDLDVAWRKQALLYERVGRRPAASEALARAVAVRLAVVNGREATPADRLTLAVYYEYWGLQEQALGKIDRAEQLLNTARATLAPLNPGDVPAESLALTCGHVLMDLGHLHLERAPEKARADYSSALEFRERLYRLAPTKANRNLLAKCHFHLYQANTAGRPDHLAAVYHYLESCLYDPSYARPWVSPGLVLTLLPRLAGLRPAPTKKASP